MKNITQHNFNISKFDRQKIHKHKSFVIWFTGLSGSGKSTIANHLESKLHKQKISTYILDGDNIRLGINKDLTFSAEDRKENIRRIGEIARLFVDAGIITMACFISPYEIDRNKVKNIVGQENYVEVFVNTSLNVCETRDVKGLYKKARKGEIKNMTGISSLYETPKNPDIEIDTEKNSIEESVNKILKLIEKKIYE